MSTRAYTVVTSEDFRSGLRCAVCLRVIRDGQPYDRYLGGMIGDTPEYVLTCVYCSDETAPES